MSPPISPELLQHVDACARYAAERTLCIVRGDADGFEGMGSALATTVDDEAFLLTAGHVIDRRLDGDEAVFIAPAPGTTGLTEIDAEHAFRTTTKKLKRLRDDPIDVAVIPLRGDSVARVASAITSLREADAKDKGSSKALYMAVGYPHENVTIDAEARTFDCKPQAYFGPGVDPAVRRPKVRTAVELRIRFSRSKCMNSHGRQIAAPPMHGMSGGGVWRVVNSSGEREYPPRLVGILHTLDEVARATTIPVVVHALTLHFAPKRDE